MTVFYAHTDPMFSHPMGGPRRMFRPWARRMSASPCSPCSFPLLKLLLVVTLFPLMARGFFFFIQLALCAFPIAMIALISSACSWCSEGDSPCAIFKNWSCTGKEHEEHDSKATKSDDKPSRRVDLSSVHVAETPGDENLTVVVAAPGVRNEDLDVSVVDNLVTIKGESTKGSDVFRVGQRIVLPQGRYDGEAASATHTDGALTLVFKKRASKRIPVTVQAAGQAAGEETPPPPLAKDAASAKDAAVAKDPSEQVKVASEDAPKSEDEWESLDGEKKKEQ